MLNIINYETFWHNTLCRINHWERRHRGVSMISRNHFARTFLVIWHIYGILIMSWSLSSSRFVFRLYVLSTVHHSIHLCILFLYIYIYIYIAGLSLILLHEYLYLRKKRELTRGSIVSLFISLEKLVKRTVSRYTEKCFDGKWNSMKLYYLFMDEKLPSQFVLFLKVFLVDNGIIWEDF